MGWGTQLETTIFASRIRKNEIEDKIKENEETIQSLEKELMMFAASSPRDVVSNETLEHGEIIQEIKLKMNEILEGYKECISENRLLYLIQEEIDKAEDC